MSTTSTSRHTTGLNALIGDTLRSVRDLVSSELALFKDETAENVRRAVIGLIFVVIGAVFAIVAASMLAEALVEWLAVVLENEALAAGVVAVGSAIVASAAIMIGINRISGLSLTPNRTIQSIKRDAEIISEKVT